MKIFMDTYLNPNDIEIDRYTIVFVGDASDERGRFVHQQLAEHDVTLYTTKYLSDEQTLDINGEQIPPYELDKFNDFSSENILIEATTLGSVEIILLTRNLFMANCDSVSYIYIEPENYQRSISADVVSKRDFEITGMRNNYEPLPGMNYQLETGFNTVTFFAGFEGQRMSQAFEDHEITPSRSSVVFGVPAFKPGWEMDSFANHVDLLVDNGINTRHQYCAANNPYLSYGYLEERYQHKRDHERMFVIPLGTKPQTIGVSAFLVNYSDVGVMYDFPRAADNCSQGISKCHHFTLEK